uniref:Flagellar protein FlbB n=1 Tax=uncultured bacterium contig00042 TaxID=1181529 RepID=A0A806KPG3_9BACT|nr:flagellar protein FlbB [uncultured bacterium contig00042]
MIGRSIVLLLLIGILSVGGIIWFDYLNVIDAKTALAPIYKYIPFVPGEGRSQPQTEPDEFLNLDAERLAAIIERMELKKLEMDTREKDLDDRYGKIEQMAQEIEEQKKALEEMENSIRTGIADAENKDRNVEQNARYLTGMPPQNAVGILAALDDQDAIDVLRKTEEIARAEGTTSVVAYWLSLMEPARAAELQRKMAGRPSSL